MEVCNQCGDSVIMDQFYFMQIDVSNVSWFKAFDRNEK